MVRWLSAAAIAIAVMGAPRVVSASAAEPTFATPEDAVRALADAVKAEKLDAVTALFGADGQDLVASSDPATGRRNRQVFVVAFAEGWRLVDQDPTHKVLIIGNEGWPFPVPLVHDANGWRFDTASGKEEVLSRRIGRNELEVIEICRAYVAAQRRYAQDAHDGAGPGVYAMKFRSDAGRHNGLYWAAARGEKRSPLGDLVAQAAAGGRPLAESSQSPTPFYGYYFKILTAQGASAAGGSKSYLVAGQMSAGFALVAWPAQYDATGIMTFVVNQDGVVREKDLGPETDSIASAMTQFNPDGSWSDVR
jgi:hypothetical protein